MNKRLFGLMFCLPAAAALTGCSSFQSTIHLVEPECDPVLSLNAVASADTGVEVPQQMFSLVAADSLGLSTFRYEIAMWDVVYEDYASAE